MKRISISVLISIIICLNGYFVTLYAKEQKQQEQFAVYLVNGFNAFDASKMELNDLELENKPILVSNQISEYNWYSHEFKLKNNRLEKVLAKKVPLSGKPFVVVARGERIYVGAFWTPLSSLYYPDIPTISSLWITESDVRTYKIEYRGKDDKRGDTRIYQALKSANILNEIYKIPAEKIKKKYSVTDFKNIYKEYLRFHNENLETFLKKDEEREDYKIHDITPADVKKELNCQIFKVNNNCESYLIYKGELFKIGIGFGGFGVTDLKVCNFDGNGQKDLIYIFSWGSGLHRSQIGIFDFSKKKETYLNFVQKMEDLQLEKISNSKFNIYSTELTSKDSKLVFIKKKLLAKITSTNQTINIKYLK